MIVPIVSDSSIGRAASRARWGRLLEAGVEIHQYQRALFHCKTMIVDDAWVSTGSVNFDNRSFTINDEINLNFLDRDVAREHVGIFEEDLAESIQYTLEDYRNRPWTGRIGDELCSWLRSQL